MKNIFKKLSSLLLGSAMLFGVGVAISSVHSGVIETKAADALTVKYTISSKTVVKSTDAPSTTAATYSQTYGTMSQMTKGNSTTLTLSGYKNYKITGLTLSMKSNAKAGAGTFSLTAGSNTIASISEATTFNKWYDNAAYSTSYKDVKVTLTNADYTIQKDENIVCKITATINSLFIQSYTFTFEAKEVSSLSYSGTPTKTVYASGDSFDPTGLTIKATYSDDTEETIGNADVTWSPSPLTEGTTSVTGTYNGKTITVTGITVKTLSKIEASIVIETGDWDIEKTELTKSVINVSWDGTGSESIDLIKVTKSGQITLKTTDSSLITKAIFTCTVEGEEKYGPGCFAGENYTASEGYTGIWELEEGAASFSLTAKSNQVRITKIELTILTSSPMISINNIENLEIGDDGTFSCATINTENPTIQWSSSNNDVLSVDTNGDYMAFAGGDVTVTATMTCAEASSAIIAKYIVGVNYGKITVEKANEIASALDSTIKEKTKSSIILEGYITNISEDNQITLSDEKVDTESSNSIKVYGYNQTTALKSYAILNAKVSVKGNLQNYSETLELINPEFSNYKDDARDFADMFVGEIKDICADVNADNEASLSEVWSTLQGTYDLCDSYAKAKLAASSFTDTYANLVTFAEKYDHIVAKYNLTNFVGRTTATSSRINPLAKVDNTTTIAIIVVISLTSLTAIGGYLFIRKHKEQ